MTRAAAAAAGLLLALPLCGCGDVSGDAAANVDAGRIVTLAPHLAELVFAVGAGDRLVAVSAFTDHPDAARSLPVVSDAFTVDQEQLALLKPDLILAWESGTPRQLVDDLQVAGYRVEVIRSRRIDHIAAALIDIGKLVGRESDAQQAAARFTARLDALREEFAARPPVRVFYQVSARPLYTIGGSHYISEIITLCGGRNVFGDLDVPAPAVTVESVVDRNPEVILGGSADGVAAFAQWRRWPHLDVNRFDNFFLINSDQIGRPSLRVAAAAAAVCESLDAARQTGRAGTHGRAIRHRNRPNMARKSPRDAANSSFSALRPVPACRRHVASPS